MDQPKDYLQPHVDADKEWYLSLLDEESQFVYEQERIGRVLSALKIFYVSRYQKRIAAAKEEIAQIRAKSDYSAEDYRAVLNLNAQIRSEYKKLNAYKCFFSEPYFSRMDVEDDDEGYNSYYIGKKGDVKLEIVDWRAPLAVRYYQKSRVSFRINETEYRTVLRRALSVKNGKLLGFKNEYLSVKGVLSPEEIAGRDEEILFDPYLRSIIKSRKDDTQIRDIIQTIQEQQFEIVTRPERESFVLQGCAGSGKTMILLHRLSYLMYNNENLSPRNVLVITPSDSFNAFIDELSQVLELQRVRTVTLKNYYARVLANEGIQLEPSEEKEPQEYLAYLFSQRFTADTEKRIRKIYEGLYGLFAGEECKEVAAGILADCGQRQAHYAKIKNASLRVRRAVLGELKERKDGGFYFTKPFRTMMSAYVQVEDFLNFVLEEEPRTPDYFFRQYVEFFRSAYFISANAEKIFPRAEEDLRALTQTVEKEILDFKRYRRRIGTQEVLTYADRIARREELKEEIEKTLRLLQEMQQGQELFREFFAVVRMTGHSRELGKCKTSLDVVRWLYRNTVKKGKEKFGMKGLYPSDGYALCAMLALAGRKLTPRYGLVFIDEGQDISEGEYALLRRIHSDAAFNVFGDLKQNVTPFRGVKEWGFLNCPVYTLKQNYRNTNEIVEHVSKILDADMLPIGLHGEPVQRLNQKQLGAFFRGKQGLKALIAKEEYLPLFDKRGFRLLPAGGKISKSRVNVMTVLESKGLEFSAVAVYDRGMTENEKYIAYTRALRELAVVEE